MKNIVQYTTAKGGNARQLDGAVNTLIAQGFEPYGNPYMTTDDDLPQFWQAMIKRRDATYLRESYAGTQPMPILSDA